LQDKEFFKDKYRATFAEFCQQLEDLFTNLDAYRERLASLLTTNGEGIQVVPLHAATPPGRARCLRCGGVKVAPVSRRCGSDYTCA
jgi:hypothetical protein